MAKQIKKPKVVDLAKSRIHWEIPADLRLEIRKEWVKESAKGAPGPGRAGRALSEAAFAARLLEAGLKLRKRRQRAA